MWQETSREPFCTFPLLPSLIGFKVNWQIPILKKKYRFHCFTDISVEVTCNVTVVILEYMFGNIKSAFSIYGGIGEGECAVELACLQMLNISLRMIFTYLFIYLFIFLFIYLFIHSFILLEVGTILVLADKNQPTNQKYSHTYIKLNNINININVKT